MIYFSKITQNYWTAKNKAHEQVLEVIKLYDKTLIDGLDVESFINDIQKAINNVNSNNPRCKYLKLNIWEAHIDKDPILSIPGIFSMTIYKACNNYNGAIIVATPVKS